MLYRLSATGTAFARLGRCLEGTRTVLEESRDSPAKEISRREALESLETPQSEANADRSGLLSFLPF